MRRLRLAAALAAGIGIASSVAAQTAASAGPRIVVGPDTLVSRDGNFPHVELILATNPKDVKNMVGGAITYTQPGGGTANRAYATVDGGATWKASEFAEQVQHGGADPYVVITPQGTAVFTNLSFKKDDQGRTRGFLHAYRSTDGGLTWSEGNELGYSYDHQQMTVDQTTGRFSGRIYMGVLYGPYPMYTVGVFRSEDDGKTWIGPVEAANGGGKIGINDVMPMVLSDGTLVMPYGDFEFLPDKVKTTGKAPSTTWIVLSTDGGVSFGKPRKVATTWYDFDDKTGKSLSGFPSLAADSRSKDFKDRIYVAWADAKGGRQRILFTRSEDRGMTWSDPIRVDATAPKSAYQYQPVVAVNKDGVVGVSWFDSRDAKEGLQYHQHFTASLDGGKSFLPAVRVSSAISDPKGEGNMVYAAFAGKHKTTSYISLVSAASRWQSGGDYMGMAADRDGVFHPFWADSRSGTFQIYTTTVSVVLPPKDGAVPAAAAAAPPAPAKPRAKSSLEGKVELVFDPSGYDGKKKRARIPIRLRNVSKSPIYPPITLEVLGFDLDDPEIAKYPYPPVYVVNAKNGKKGEGALFDFGGALGSLESLAPGAQTGPVVLELEFTDPTEVPAIRYRLEGMVEE